MAARVQTIGLDIAKDVFQVHGIDKAGKIVLRRKLRRGEVVPYFRRLKPCLIGMESCATSHHWGRSLVKLGHSVKLVPANFVKPFVKSQKNDAADAEAICEAVVRPNMRFVPVKTAEQQAVLTVHRARDLLLRQRTMLINCFRALVAEFGHVARLGKLGVDELLQFIGSTRASRLIPTTGRNALNVPAGQIRQLTREIGTLEAQIKAWHRANEQSRRLGTIPGISHISATAVVANVPDPHRFKNGRSFAAWLGLVPQQNSSGGNVRLGGISKRGNTYLRRLLVAGARSALLHYKQRDAIITKHLRRLAARKPFLVVAVALANRIARVAWALLANGEIYRNLAST